MDLLSLVHEKKNFLFDHIIDIHIERAGLVINYIQAWKKKNIVTSFGFSSNLNLFRTYRLFRLRQFIAYFQTFLRII